MKENKENHDIKDIKLAKYDWQVLNRSAKI